MSRVHEYKKCFLLLCMDSSVGDASKYACNLLEDISLTSVFLWLVNDPFMQGIGRTLYI